MPRDAAKIDEIIALILKEVPVDQRPFIPEFIHTFFKRKKYADLSVLSNDVIAGFMLSLWHFFAQRSVRETKVEIRDLSELEQPGKTRIIINVLTENKPFLADSFMWNLRQEGIVAHIFSQSCTLKATSCIV